MKTLIFTLINILFIVNNGGAALFISEKMEKSSTAKQIEFQEKQKELDSYYSNKKLGSFVENGNTYFRLFTPNAVKVILVTFEKLDDKKGKEYEMTRDEDAVWEFSIKGEKYGLFYGFKVYHKNDEEGIEKPICVDPYAKAVATFNTYLSPRRAIVIKENNYNWEDDKWIQRPWSDLIIYEMHVRDMTAHSSSGAKNPGTYKGLTEKNIKGGIDYIKNLGVNTVELLPAMEFANIEIPYQDSMLGRMNTWNPYERNHWGYMTAAFFAPEAYYAQDWKKLEWNKWMGGDAKQVNDFKDMVKAFHKEGIGVMMDVVYNHLSEYELGNLKEIDKEYYFRLDANGNFIAESYCGNDLKTERPMVRRMIVESILYWMTEYHIDGFRFDLGKLIDWKTLETIIYEAQKINPNVVFVAEPWGGGYDPMGFSLRGWGSWNDQIRNGIKGENPFNGHGWIFSKWFGNNDPQRIKSYVTGTLTKDIHGLFIKKEHSVNYLESHDGYTLGDFIRIGLGQVDTKKPIEDIDAFVKLTPEQLKLNKLAALFLLTSQGIIMIHSGQEFARSKVIKAESEINDSHAGLLDHNSYEKDNETNYINYAHAEINKDLFNYYKGLIELRNHFFAFKRGNHEDVQFYEINDNPFAIGFYVKKWKEEFIVLMNAHTTQSEEYELPIGNWDVLVNENSAGIKVLNTYTGKVTIKPSSGMVLKRK